VVKWEYQKENIQDQEGTKRHPINIFFLLLNLSVQGADKSNFPTGCVPIVDTIKTGRYLK